MTVDRRSILHNVGALVSTQVAGRVIRFIFFVAVARYLSAAEVGIYSYGMAAYLSLLGLGAFGQSTLLATRVGRHRACFARTAAHSLTILVTGLVVVTTFGLGLLWLTEPESTTRWALAFFMLAILARGLAMWVRSSYVALERSTWIPRYEVMFRSAEAVIGIAALALGAGLVAICFLHFAFWTLEAAASILLMTRDTGVRPRFGTRLPLLRRYAMASLPIMLALWLINLFPQIGIIGLKQLQADVAGVAHFAIAMQFLTTLFVLPVSLSQAVLPGLARAQRNRSEADFMVLRTVLKLSLIAGALAAAATAVIGPSMIVMVFGDRYLEAGLALVGMMWGFGPYAAAFIAICTLNALNFRARSATAAFLMVMIQTGGMVLLAGPAGLDPVTATITGFLLASLAGMAWSLDGLALALSQASAPTGRRWWMTPAAIVLLSAAISLGGWMHPLLASLAVLAVILVGTTLVLSRRETAALFAKAGLRQRAIARWLGGAA